MSRSWTHTGYAQRVHFGAGALDSLPAVLKEVGGRRVLLVSTKGRLESDDGARVVKLLGRSLAATYDGARSHVPTTKKSRGMARRAGRSASARTT